jgi:predicted nucleic-acid-binding Zn-ribbon protein
MADDQLRCPVCGSLNVETGRIRGTGRMVFQNTKKLFDWGRPMITSACLDCGHVWLRLRNVGGTGDEHDPHHLVDQYRKVVAKLVTATNQVEIDAYRSALGELQSKWRTQHGTDSLHEAAFGDSAEENDREISDTE